MDRERLFVIGCHIDDDDDGRAAIILDVDVRDVMHRTTADFDAADL